MALSKCADDDFDRAMKMMELYEPVGSSCKFTLETLQQITDKLVDKARKVDPKDFYCMDLSPQKGSSESLYYDTSSEPIRAYLDFTPHELAIPDDMIRFYERYGTCTFSHSNVGSDEHEEETHYPEFLALSEIEYAMNELDNTYFGQKQGKIMLEDTNDLPGSVPVVNMCDYFKFFHDPHSVDNGCGSFFINLNPQSSRYGNVYAYSSTDDGLLAFVAHSFTGFLTTIVNVAERFLSRAWVLDEPPLSVCDYLRRKVVGRRE